jgi:replicative DNA helicase
MYIGKEFSIVSKMACGRYLDVIGNNAVTKTRNTNKTQKWVFDYASRTVINVGTKKSLNFYSNQVNVSTTNSDWTQLFRY